MQFSLHIRLGVAATAIVLWGVAQTWVLRHQSAMNLLKGCNGWIIPVLLFCLKM